MLRHTNLSCTTVTGESGVLWTSFTLSILTQFPWKAGGSLLSLLRPNERRKGRIRSAHRARPFSAHFSEPAVEFVCQKEFRQKGGEAQSYCHVQSRAGASQDEAVRLRPTLRPTLRSRDGNGMSSCRDSDIEFAVSW